MPSSKAQQQALEVVLMSLVGRAAFILRDFVLVGPFKGPTYNSCRNFKGTTFKFRVFCSNM